MDWYPWHPARYKEKTLHLTAEQDGIYRRLIDHYMETRRPLPDNDIALARISGVDLACFEHSSSIIRAFFKQRKDGFLNHQTCDEMLNEQDSKLKFRTERAKRAAEKRWSNQVVTEISNASSMPEAMQNSDFDMLENATVNSRDIDTNVSITPLPPKPNIQTNLFDQFWQIYPRQRRGSKDKALTAYKVAIRRGNTEQQILQGGKRYAASSDVARGYAKGCAAWLNDDGFNNEYQSVGAQGSTNSGSRRGFDALATAAAEIQESMDHDAELLRQTNPILYYQQLADQSGRENGIAGSLEAPDTHEHDAAPLGIGYGEEN